MKYLLAALMIVGGSLAANDPNLSYLDRIQEPVSPRNAQILLVKDAQEALLEVVGPYYIFNPHDGSRVASGLLGKRFMVHELENGLKWGEQFPGIHQIYIKPRSAETKIFVNGIEYSGSVAVYGVSGSINVVNDLDVESYIKSVLSSEFSSPLESEVLSALAILARTNAYYHATRNPDSFWHFAAEEVGYLGSALIVPGSPITKAVDSTRHLILVHPENGKSLPFAATWTENSAGKTAPYEVIFRKDVFAPEKGAEAPHAQLAREESKWTYQISRKKIADLFNLSELKAIETFIDTPSKKVYGIRLKGKNDTLDIDFVTFQNRLGKNHLLSSDFTVKTKEDSIEFVGFGKGHGAGLCLYSASALAQNGVNAVKILAKFFPETYLYNISALPEGVAKKD